MRAGRYLMPSTFTATLEPGEMGPYSYELRFEVEDGRPVCTEVKCSRVPGGPPIRQKGGLRELKVSQVEQWAAAYLSLRESASGSFDPVDSLQEAAEFVSDRRDRWFLTDEHLSEVAETYTAAVQRSANPTEAVGIKWGRPRSSASRWVKACRQRGFLPPATPGRPG